MKWLNHLAIAGATTAVINPALVPIAFLGATAPDWLEWVIQRFQRRKVKHRGVTHIVLYWLVGLGFTWGLWDFHGVLSAFCYGGLTHVLADALTVSGVPFSPSSDRRFHLFGGRLRTGGAGEYGIAWGIVLLCLLIVVLFKPHGGIGWMPFFYDWAGLYESGVIDAKEWKDNRLRFF